MDPQLTKQLIRRRLILENSLENSINYENKINNIEVSSILVTDNIPSNNIKHNFLEKIKKFESFSDNPIKKTHQNIADKPRNNTEIINKFNNLNKDTVLKRIKISNKLEFDNPEGLYNNKNKDNLNEKIKQFETSFVLENKILKLNTSYLKENLQTSNELNLTKTLKKKRCSKSDYNNWEIDKNWVFYTDYSKANIEKSILKNNKLLSKRKNTLKSFTTAQNNMDSFGTRMFTSHDDTPTIDNIITGNTRTCSLISLGSDVDNEVKLNNSQLLSTDGWENYQKDFIQLCFEFWEVNETQVKVKSSVQSDSVSELQTPSSLFADSYYKNVIEFESKATIDNVIISDKVQIKGCPEINDNSLSKYEDAPDIQESSKAINTNIDAETNENSSTIVDNKVNKRTKKKLKTFSFYKNTNKQVKPSKKVLPLTFNGYTSCTLEDLWKYKKWLDSVDEVKKYNPDIDIKDGYVKENKYSDKVNCDKINNFNTYSPDFEAKEMEQKVRKLIKSLNEKDKFFSNIGINEHSTGFGSSNKFKYFFKNAFRGTQNEYDTQILDDYTKFINHKLHTWQSLLNCLEDIRRRKSSKIKMCDTLEDTIKYRFSEINDRDFNVTDDNDDNNSKFVEINDNFGEIGKLKKNKFFKLLSKTKSTMDMRTFVKRTTERNSPDNSQMNNYQCTSNANIDGKILKMDTEILSMIKNRKSSGRIRKSLSDTDLPVMASDYNKKLKQTENRSTRINGKKLIIETSMTDEEYNHRWDGVTRELWEERQECFQTAVARLEYVGSTFKDQCRLDGLKTLCKVDVLAGFGYSAEAVDLFVSTLPLSKNPDLMIRKAEAAYDWRFFCHLSMWRYSYKD